MINLNEILDSYKLSTRSAAKVLGVGVASINNWKIDSSKVSARNMDIIESFLTHTREIKEDYGVSLSVQAGIILALREGGQWRGWNHFISIFSTESGKEKFKPVSFQGTELIKENLGLLGSGLEVITEDNEKLQFDLLCRDRDGKIVGIEHKKKILRPFDVNDVLKRKANLVSIHGRDAKFILLTNEISEEMIKLLDEVVGLSVFSLNLCKIV